MSKTFRGINYIVQTLPKPTSNISILIGSAKGDWIEAAEGSHKILTRAGDDVILAGVSFLDFTDSPLSGGQSIVTSPVMNAGNYTIEAGTGNDYVVTGGGNDYVDLGDGDDVYNSTLFGNPSAASGNDKIFGGNGNDRIIATGSGNKTLDGGSGNDFLHILSFGVTNSHHVDAGSGDDNIAIFSPDSNVVMNGGQGNDAVEITVKDGKISLGSGNDSGQINCGTGKIDLGDGNDQIIVNFSVPSGPSTATSTPSNAQVLGGGGQ
jgi:Ca2+-binding RTX toxin-like protein